MEEHQKSNGSKPRPASRLLLLLILVAAFPPVSAQAEEAEFPLTRVALFKNGIGFFEHQGTVQNSETIRIPVGAHQLDDILKSITVLDLDGGTVGSVSYGSSAPLERQLSALETGDLRGKDLREILNDLVGTRLEADSPNGKIRGRLLAADIRSSTGADNPSGIAVEKIELSLYTDAGELAVLDLQSLDNLHFSNEKTRQDLSRYLEIVADNRDNAVRYLEIQTQGSGERDLRISYTAEAPVWKAAYRLILEDEQPAVLQGWAIVDNTTPNDWTKINLSLISSSPVSFRQRLSEPVYSQRPEVPVSVSPQVSPELYQGGIEPGGEVRALSDSTPASPQMQEPSFRALPVPSATRSSLGKSLSEESFQATIRPAADSGKRGDQYEYSIATPVTLRKNQSALIPIIQEHVEVDKVSIYTPESSGAIPRSGIWIENNTGMTLDAGPFMINDQGIFAGEGLTDTIYPGQKRLLSYALDRALLVEKKAEGSKKDLLKISRDQGVFLVTHKLLDTTVYRIRNENETKRDLIIEHPIRNGWTLVEPTTFEEKSAGNYRFRTETEADSSIRFEVKEERTISQRFNLDSINEDQISLWISGSEISAETREQLAPLVSQTRKIQAVQKEITGLEEEKASIFSSQERIRQNLSSLGNSPAEAKLRQRYVTQLESEENRLESLEDSLQREKETLESLRRQLSEMIAGLEF